MPEVPTWLRAAAAEHEARQPLVVRLNLEGGITSLHGPPMNIGLVDGVADGFYCDAGLAPFEARPELWEELRSVAKSGAQLVIHDAAGSPHYLARFLAESRPTDAPLTQAVTGTSWHSCVSD